MSTPDATDVPTSPTVDDRLDAALLAGMRLQIAHQPAAFAARLQEIARATEDREVRAMLLAATGAVVDSAARMIGLARLQRETETAKAGLAKMMQEGAVGIELLEEALCGVGLDAVRDQIARTLAAMPAATASARARSCLSAGDPPEKIEAILARGFGSLDGGITPITQIDVKFVPIPTGQADNSAPPRFGRCVHCGIFSSEAVARDGGKGPCPRGQLPAGDGLSKVHEWKSIEAAE